MLIQHASRISSTLPSGTPAYLQLNENIDSVIRLHLGMVFRKEKMLNRRINRCREHDKARKHSHFSGVVSYKVTQNTVDRELGNMLNIYQNASANSCSITPCVEENHLSQSERIKCCGI